MNLRIIGVSEYLDPQTSSPDEIQPLLVSPGSEPLGHELLREAIDQRYDSPRSSLVLALVAAEVGFKACVAKLVPEAAWLVENVPSPPLETMLRDYLPTLPARCKLPRGVLPPPPELMAILKKGVKLRNDLVHRGRASLTPETLSDVLSAVRDLLWMFDYYSGYAWATSHLTTETRSRLESHRGAGIPTCLSDRSRVPGSPSVGRAGPARTRLRGNRGASTAETGEGDDVS